MVEKTKQSAGNIQRLELCQLIEGLWLPVPDSLLKRILRERKKITRGATKPDALNENHQRHHRRRNTVP